MGCSSSRTAPAWVPATRCSPSGADCSSAGFPWSHGLLRAQPPAPVWGPPRAAGESRLWHTSSLSFFTDLGVCVAVSLTSHSSLHCRFFSSLFPLLKYVVTEALPPSLTGSALVRRGSDLEPGKLLAASHRSHACSPSPATQTQHTWESGCLPLVLVFPRYGFLNSAWHPRPATAWHSQEVREIPQFSHQNPEYKSSAVSGADREI